MPQHGFLVYISDRSNAEITHTIRWFSRPWRKITAIADNHGPEIYSGIARFSLHAPFSCQFVNVTQGALIELATKIVCRPRPTVASPGFVRGGAW